ncbi:MAG TPA: hypothetical protein DCR93_20445 [Cytophagales bacterium]|nr:hypothetical protein [Cytophagales bacterium]
MKLAHTLSLLSGKTLPPRQVLSDRWEDRETILQPQVNLYCWQRPMNPAILAHLGQQMRQDLPAISCLRVTQKHIAAQLGEARTAWEPEPSHGGDSFWQDLIMITRDFLAFSKNGSGQIHLKVVRDDACRKFHTDGYRLRLFTTYYGRGTEWLPERATNRAALGKNNEKIVKDPALVKRMEPFQVGILKGEVPNTIHTVKGIVHRSPPIAQAGERRLIHRVDI